MALGTRWPTLLDSVTKRVRALVEQGLIREGYQSSADPGAPNSVAMSVIEFWAWMTPGFAALTFEAKITCVVTVNNGDGGVHTVTIHGNRLNHGQFAKNTNWQEAYEPAFDECIANLAREVGGLGLRSDKPL
jgi:uncharacterized lipoprotein YajG